MIDVHTHILPAIDDGATNVAVSVNMLKMLDRQGVTDVVATPHFKPSFISSVDRFLLERDKSHKLLLNDISGMSNLPRVRLGAEVTLCVDMARLENLERLCIEGTPYLLVEFDISSFDNWVYNTLFEIRVRRYVIPIIAHIDRYFGVLRHETIKKIMDLGCPTQFNASSLIKLATRAKTVNLIREYPEQICLVGSDCHDVIWRKPEMDKFAAKADKIVGEGFLDYLQNRSQAMLDGKIIY